MSENTKLSEKYVQKLIRKTLVYGVFSSTVLLIAGLIFFLVSGRSSEAGTALAHSGLVLLLITPAARVAMLGYGYYRCGQPSFAAMASAVLLLLAAGCLIS